MIPDKIPDGLPLPTESMGMKELAELYKRSVSTLQRAFNKNGIYIAIGERFGRDFTPEQLLIIFYLYFPPSKYYRTFLWLEQNGHIEQMVKKFGLDKKKKGKDKK